MTINFMLLKTLSVEAWKDTITILMPTHRAYLPSGRENELTQSEKMEKVLRDTHSQFIFLN